MLYVAALFCTILNIIQKVAALCCSIPKYKTYVAALYCNILNIILMVAASQT